MGKSGSVSKGEGMQARATKLISRVQQGVTIVQFTDAKVIDQRNINQIGEEMLEMVEKGGVRKMVINLDSVRLLSSAVLTKLISLHKALRTNKGDLKLCHIAPQIHQVFEFTRLDRVFAIYKTEAEALEAFRLGG